MEFQVLFVFCKIKTIHIPGPMNASVSMSLSHLHMYTPFQALLGPADGMDRWTDGWTDVRLLGVRVWGRLGLP